MNRARKVEERLRRFAQRQPGPLRFDAVLAAERLGLRAY
jgi:hypothetical protein